MVIRSTTEARIIGIWHLLVADHPTAGGRVGSGGACALRDTDADGLSQARLTIAKGGFDTKRGRQHEN